MLFGNKDIYAIEVYHQPLDNDSFYMTGRMCIHLYNTMFGNIDDRYCHLYVTYATLLSKIECLNELEHNFNLDNDCDIFNFLDELLYIGDDDRTLEQIKTDWEQYGNFDFMTNAGEMFDRTKSFIYMDSHKKIHILYQEHKYNENIKDFIDGEIICTELDKETFEHVTNGFIKWYEENRNK